MLLHDSRAEKRRFLELAMREIDGKASSEERDELKSLRKSNPDFEKHFYEIRRELELSKDDDFWETSLRVMFHGGTSEEVARVRGFKETAPKQWTRFLEIAFSLAALGKSSDSGRSPAKMPEAVRNRLLAGLEQKKQK